MVLTDTNPLRLMQWISNEEFLFIQGLRAKATIEIYNTRTREVTPLAMADIMGRPLWSAEEQTVLYRAYDYRTERTDLWWVGLDSGEPQLLSKEIDHPFLLGGKGGGGIGWQPEEGKLVSVKGDGAEAQALDLDFSPYMPPKLSGRNIGYRVAPSPTGGWQAAYNRHYFLLVDVDEGVIVEIPLPGQVLGVSGNPAPVWALLAVWSPDGGQIAIIATTGEPPIDYEWLYIYDVQTRGTMELEMPRDVYFSNLAWSPDSHFLLVQIDVGVSEEGFPLQGVWLFDINTGQSKPKDLLPAQVTGGFTGEELIWSPDGKLIAFSCHLVGSEYWRTCISEVKVQ